MRVRGPANAVAHASPVWSTGYARLWEALVLDAIQTVQRYPSADRVARAAWQWLQGAPAPLACADICEVLGIDHGALMVSIGAFGLPRPRPQAWRPRPPIGEAQPCAYCGALFAPVMRSHRFCCSQHQHRFAARRMRMRRRGLCA